MAVEAECPQLAELPEGAGQDGELIVGKLEFPQLAELP